MKNNRPSIESLACQNPDCQDHQKTNLDNLTVRKTYGQDQIRYLRCRTCGLEFSERKNTMLWNTKISESRAVQIADCLSDKNSLKGTVRIAKANKSTVKRLRREIGKQAKGVHNALVKNVKAKVVEFDERYGFAVSKDQAVWEGTAIDPISKLTISLCVGNRDEFMAQHLMEDVQQRLKNPSDVLAISDGFISYQTNFAEIYGRKYSRKNKQGKKKMITRIPRGVAHAVVKKEYKGKRLVGVNTLIAHGTKKRVLKGLKRMGDFKINTSAVERSNLTNRSMNAYQVRKSAAFARSLEARHSLAWWVTTVLNFSRISRVLRIKLESPIGRRLYQDRTPAMAAGIADHVWGTLELLRFVIPRKGG